MENAITRDFQPRTLFAFHSDGLEFVPQSTHVKTFERNSFSCVLTGTTFVVLVVSEQKSTSSALTTIADSLKFGKAARTFRRPLGADLGGKKKKKEPERTC